MTDSPPLSARPGKLTDHGDRLLQHIEASGLPLRLRRATVMDGNCWYDAVGDQVRLHQIPDRPEDHQQLRLEVCRSLRRLPQTSTWVEHCFNNNKKRFSNFLARHRRVGTWTDNMGIMCQATAIYLGKDTDHGIMSLLTNSSLQVGTFTSWALPTTASSNPSPDWRRGERRTSSPRCISDTTKGSITRVWSGSDGLSPGR